MKNIQSIGFIGAGNVASHLASALLDAEYDIPFLFNRHEGRKDLLPEQLRGLLTQDIGQLARHSPDLIIIAVGDQNIEEVVRELGRVSIPLVHTSGAIHSKILKQSSYWYGSFYPLQTLTMTEHADLKNVPICICSNEEKTEGRLVHVAKDISDHVRIITDDKRKWLHLTAVMMNNNINHLLSRASDLMDFQGLSSDLLQPLLEETIRKATLHDARRIQTGPAKRNDRVTYKIHMDLLDEYGDESLKKLYDYFWQTIQNYHDDDIRE